MVVEPVESCSPAKLSHFLNGSPGCGGRLPDTDDTLHGEHALLMIAQILLAHRPPDEIGDRCLLATSTRVKRAPKLVIQVELCPSHDVEYTSRKL